MVVCLVPGNPDVTGIGVRIALYVQSVIMGEPYHPVSRRSYLCVHWVYVQYS